MTIDASPGAAVHRDRVASHAAESSARWRRVAGPFAAIRLTGQALEFLGWVVLARRLGASPFGELAMAFLACRYAGLVADWGATTRGPRDVTQRSGHELRHDVRFRGALAVALALGVALVLAALGHRSLIPVVGVVLSLGWGRDWMSLGGERGARAGLPLGVQGLALLGLAIVVTPSSAAWAVGCAYLLSALLSVALNPLPNRSEPPAATTAATRSTATRVAAWMTVAVLAVQVTSSLDTLLLGWIGSARDAGIYAAVYRLPNAWIALLGAVFAGLIPVASRTRREGHEAFVELGRRSLRTSGRIAAAVAVSAPVAAVLVPVVFGSQYREGALACGLLVLATAVITWAAPLHPLVVAAGDDRRYALVVLGGAALNVTLDLVLIPAFGLPGAAVATLLAQVAISLRLWVIHHRSSVGVTAGTPRPTGVR